MHVSRAHVLTVCYCLKCAQIAWKTSQQSQGQNLEEVGQEIFQNRAVFWQFVDKYVSHILLTNMLPCHSFMKYLHNTLTNMTNRRGQDWEACDDTSK